MATVPVKSQPLHNFSLPCWKWGNKNQINDNHRRRRPSESAGVSSLPSDCQRSDGGSDSENRKFSFAYCSALKHRANVSERESNGVDGEREKVSDDHDVVEADESAAKPWNLRPRKALTKVAIEIGELKEKSLAVSAIHAVQQTENLPKSLRLRGFSEGGLGSEKKEKKRKFWISLSREEIEEDVYSMTGSKPARRPKKRAKNVQKQLDNLFPGLHFAGVSADFYRVHDALR